MRRFDLQDMWRANPKAFIAGAVVILAAFGALVVKGAVGSSSHKHHTHAIAARTTSTPARSGMAAPKTENGVTVPSSSYQPAYSNHVPDSPADQKFAALLSGQQTAAVEGVNVASPAWTPKYPAIKSDVLHDEDSYVAAFLEELLDRNYANETRANLGRWVSAESAGELVPGIPAAVGNKVLYAEIMDPQTVGETGSPVPSSAEWATLSGENVQQHAYGIFVHPDAQWQTLKDDGLTSRDPLLDMDDATGVLSTTRGGHTSTKHFSLQVVVGSALHHPGYGAAGAEQWEVN